MVISKKLTELKNTDFFLDSVTGDLYNYNAHTNDWAPRANAGLHFRLAAQEYNTVGKFIIQKPVFRVNSVQQSKLFKSKNTETICYIKKSYLQHPFLKDVDFEFLVESANRWDPHPFNFLNPNKTFYVLGESNEGPQIISFRDLHLGLQFHVSRQYPQSVTILANFFRAKTKQIDEGYRSAPVMTRLAYATNFKVSELKINQAGPVTVLQAREEVLSPKSSQSPKAEEGYQYGRGTPDDDSEADVFIHSGYATHHRQVLVKHNSINKSVRQSSFILKEKEKDKKSDVKEFNKLERGYSLLIPNHKKSLSYLEEVVRNAEEESRKANIVKMKARDAASISQGHLAVPVVVTSNANSRPGTAVSRPSVVHSQFSSMLSLKQPIQSRPVTAKSRASSITAQESTPASEFAGNIQNSGDVRKLLHPNLPKDCFHHEPLWVRIYCMACND
jgi:hypothetical protein